MGKGRQLKSASNGNNSIIYSYDNNGLRTKKQVNDEQIYFTYIEDYLVEQHSNNSNLIFKYDKSKNIIGVNINGEDFYYIKSLQGDVSKIVNSRNEIVVEYNYDPWGKITLISGKLSDSIGLINPIRYRGYYYDNETNLYYLQSRYYDPDTCRFINADDFCFINCDINLFKSCHNNPIKYKDAKGLYPINSYYDYLYYQYKIERDNKVSATKVNINKKNIEQYKKNFVLWIYPMFADYECYAKENSKRYVPPAIATAQWSIESAYGASIPKDKNTNSNSNNYIGLKAYGTDPYVICNTREVINGKNVYVDAKFYKFSDVYQCRDKYTSLLTGNKYYVNSSNNQTWANSLQTNGYATDPSYASTIMSVINYWGLQ